MKQFKDLGIKTELHSFTGDKIKIERILNRKIVVHEFKIENSKFAGGSTKCLHLQISIGDVKHVVFTGSTVLMDMIQKVDKADFPFETMIVKENERFEFT